MNFKLQKNIAHNLVLNIPSCDGSLPQKTFSLRFDQDYVIIPEKYALSIFIEPVLREMYEDGIYSILPKEDFDKKVEEFYNYNDLEQTKINKEEVKNYILKGNINKIQELINKDNYTINTLIKDIAVQNLDEIPKKIIDLIEKQLKIIITVEEK